MNMDVALSSLDPLMSESSCSRISSLIWANCFFSPLASFLSDLRLFLLELLLALERLDLLERVDVSSLLDALAGALLGAGAVQTRAM
jgi:hypothetical protein